MRTTKSPSRRSASSRFSSNTTCLPLGRDPAVQRPGDALGVALTLAMTVPLALLAAETDFQVVGEAMDGRHAVAQVRRRAPDVVLMDVRMPLLDGLEATRQILEGPCPPSVVVLTAFDLDEHVFGALRAGAAGVLLKDTPPRDLVAAVRTVAAGNGLIAPQVTRRLIRAFTAQAPARAGDSRVDGLTARERDVLLLIARGLTNRDIARTLQIEETTIKSHVRRVLDKLGVANRVHAVVLAYEFGLVRPGDNALPDVR